MGLSRGDFCALTPRQFRLAWEEHQEAEKRGYRAGWEQARAVALSTLSPWSKKALKPTDVWPLPWDSEQAEETHRDEKAPTAEELTERRKAAAERYGLRGL